MAHAGFTKSKVRHHVLGCSPYEMCQDSAPALDLIRHFDAV